MNRDAPALPRDAVPDRGRPWPTWAIVLVSAALLYHLGAIVAGSLAAPPSSDAERRAAAFFKNYNDGINQGYGYRYYSRLDTTVDPARPRRWATPVVEAAMEFDLGSGQTGREVVRLPGRPRAWPSLRHQRQLDLAYHLAADPGWAASYARHLCKTRGCARVTIEAREHRIPDLAEARAAAVRGEGSGVDLEAETTYGPPMRLGVFSCSDF